MWENVYAYDRDFRLHMSENPKRSWSVILQQAWSMHLRDRIRIGDPAHFRGQDRNNNGNGSPKPNPKDYCKRFNKGRCTFGSKCRFEHRCYYCHKFGHGINNCRKLIADKKEKKSNGIQESGMSSANTQNRNNGHHAGNNNHHK